MSKKIIVKYIIIYLPITMGIILISSGIVNLFSCSVLFLGGYVAIKNTLDYRIVKKNINNINKDSEKIKKIVHVKKIENHQKTYVKPINYENKRTRIYSKVRKKY